MGDPMGFDVAGRLLPSLVLVIGALLLLRRWAQRGRRGGAPGGVRVLARTALTRTSVLAVVQVGQRRFLVGAADQGVSVLSELEPGDDGDGLGERTRTEDPRTTPSAATDWRAAPDRPWMGPIDRLRALTVRTHLERPIRASRP